VAARDYTQTACVARQWVEVQRDLDVPDLRVPAVRMPAGVADVVVAVAAHVVEVVAEQGRGDPQDARVVQQRRQAVALVDERHDTRAGLAVVWPGVVATAIFRPHHLELAGDLFDVVGQQAGQAEVAKGVEEGNLLAGQSEG
jgi:hypothetical protein